MIIELNNKTISDIIKNDNAKKHLVIGFFDGIHKGHLELFDNAKDKYLLTFKKIPRKEFQIYSLKERLEQLKKYGFKGIYVYDIYSSNLEAQEFINNFLKPLNVSKITVGINFTFGKDHQKATFLKEYFDDVNIVDLKLNYSSTKIRNLLLKNDFKTANEILVEDYYYPGIVVNGDQTARMLGFPTANIEVIDGLVPLKEGVYVSDVLIENSNKLHRAITYIGVPKTIVNRNKSMIESHIIDFNKDLYNKQIKVYLRKYIAPNKRFINKNALVYAINKYVMIAKEYK